MDNKAKIIIGALFLGIVIFFIISVGLFNEKTKVEREKGELEKEKTILAQQVDESRAANSRLQSQLNAVSSNLQRATNEKNDLERKIEVVLRERQELVDKLKNQQKAMQTQEQKPSASESMQRVGIGFDEAYWAGVLKAKNDLALQLDNVRQELRTIQINNEQLQREKATQELEAKNLARENEEVVRKLEYNLKLMDSIARELVREKNDKLQLQDNFKTVSNENALLRRQLKVLNNRKIDLERKFSEFQQQDAALKNKLAGMDSLVQEKMVEMESFKKQVEATRGDSCLDSSRESDAQKTSKGSVELAPIVVRPQSSASETMVAPSSGSVLALNRENNFVIIDWGEDAGVRVGDVFRIYSGEKAVADIEVIQARKEISACDIRRESEPIKVGDVVR